jgi:hypothetical protein
MIKGKIIFVVVLYLILGVIAFFNFGLYDYLVAKVERKTMVNETPWKKLGETMKRARSASQDVTQDSSPDNDSSD